MGGGVTLSASVVPEKGESVYIMPELPASASDNGLVALVSGRHLAEFDDFVLDEAVAQPVTQGAAFAHSVYHGGHRRTDFNGEVGIAFALPTSDLTVAALGRFWCSGDQQKHTVSVVRASDSKVLASAVIDMVTGVPDAAGFVYVELGSPLVIHAAPAERYYLVSSEKAGGDCFYGAYADTCGGESGGLPMYFTGTRGPAVPLGGVWRAAGKTAWNEDQTEQWLQETRRGYGPVNMLYGAGNKAVVSKDMELII